ncbi:hypothetical protein M378DRAFT_172835 [Amanita muscaria Koide BX008]|uniref:Uncharacterized protein n=1 Tax=Amanita muscaria (strain Koide BX008) TaxID=946122 RepID=A0A0C2W541_AMAMK|nr:hypothetical protein M378DRAFT_172835 [Amanita muscaria Koide BX008]
MAHGQGQEAETMRWLKPKIQASTFASTGGRSPLTRTGERPESLNESYSLYRLL